MADPGHGAQEAFQAGGIGIERGKKVGFAGRFALPFAGAQRDGKTVPVMVEALVGHLEHAADVGRLALVEEQVRGR